MVVDLAEEAAELEEEMEATEDMEEVEALPRLQQVVVDLEGEAADIIQMQGEEEAPDLGVRFSLDREALLL